MYAFKRFQYTLKYIGDNNNNIFFFKRILTLILVKKKKINYLLNIKTTFIKIFYFSLKFDIF